jgi:ATPase family associated with various cellular activities (AAA)
MSDAAMWEVHNQNYLASALLWLRLKLAWKVERVNAGDDRVLPDSLRAISEEQVAQAAMAMMEMEQIDPPPALMILVRQFGLSRFEQEIVLLCAAMELDPQVTALCAQISPNKPYPTFALALSIFDEPAWDALSAERPLRYWQLLEISQPAAQPLTTSALRADERIVNYLKGLNTLDDRLISFLLPLEASKSIDLPPSQQATAGEIVRHLKYPNLAKSLVVQLVGTDRSSKELVACEVAAELGLYIYRLPIELLPSQASELETLARLWQRETLLLPVVLYIDAQEIDAVPNTEGQASPLGRFLLRYQGLCFIATREIRPQLGQSRFALDVSKPTLAEQKAAWEIVLDSAAVDIPDLLAGQFDFNLPEIQDLARIALKEANSDHKLLRDRLWSDCLVSTRPCLDALAQRIDAKATWDDLVLPDKEINLLHQIVDQVRYRTQVYENWGFNRRMNRGLGINALFAGDSGTGKTMAAEVIANDLKLDLYRIDLSSVVNKYIGETEKNLRRLFDGAEGGGAILLFDEADALFGKRSDVQDSRDRYANIEVNYLLQRMEAYRGLAILATNLKSSVDKAFLRRLRFLIDFPFPGLAERQPIWERAFPPETPRDGLDYERLAGFNLTGGSVHNIVLNATFLAAKAGTPVTMPLVLAAIRTEFEKIDRPINEADF